MTSISREPARLRNVTATEMATLFGLNAYESPAKLIEKKKNPVDVVSNHVRRGKLKEPSVLEAFYLDAGMKTTRHFGGSVERPEYRISATPDAYVKGTTNVVECKSTMTHSFEKWYDQIPAHYHMQVLVQMLVMNSEVGYIGALEEGDPRECEYRFIAWEVHRNAEMEALMIEESARFWELYPTDKLFRINSKYKKRAQEILETTSKLTVPKERPRRVEINAEEELSKILSLFQ